MVTNVDFEYCKNDFERLNTIVVDSIENFKLMPNKVLVEFFNGHSKTVGGIETSAFSIASNYAAYSDRTAKVVKIPEKLTCSKHDSTSMLWECDVDVEVGDYVFFDPTESLHGQKIFCKKDNKVFTIAFYGSIVLAKRLNNVIMCNGYVLLEQVYETEKVIAYEKDVPIFNQGIVSYIGKPNKKYRVKNKNGNYRTDDGCDIEVGDRVILDMPQYTWMLEDWCFAVFDNRKMYKVAKRYMIAGVYGKSS